MLSYYANEIFIGFGTYIRRDWENFSLLFSGNVGISQFVYEAQRSVGWLHGKSDSGRPDGKSATARRLLDLCQVS